MPVRDETLLIEDADIMFRNFAGREQTFNSEGDRNFCVMLDSRPDLVERLTKDGWNVKYLKPREEGDEPRPYLQVKVSYGKGRPPRCVMITSRQRTDLGADEVAILDVVDIKKVDLIIRPYSWEVNGKQGVKAYLKTIMVTLNEDELERKYADILDMTEEARNNDASENDDR